MKKQAFNSEQYKTAIRAINGLERHANEDDGFIDEKKVVEFFDDNAHIVRAALELAASFSETVENCLNKPTIEKGKSLSLLVKLGSIAVHADEFMSPAGHHFDHAAIMGLLNDPEVRECLEELRRDGLLPVKRGAKCS